MRILYVTDALAVWGGIERVLSDKMNYLVREYGYEVYVVTADQGEHPIPFLLDERICVKDMKIRSHQQYRYHGVRRLLKYWKLEKLFRNRLKGFISEIRPDVISCIREGCASHVLNIKDTIPTIFESHAMFRDIEFENSTFLHCIMTYLKRKKFRELDKIITLSEGDANDWKRVCDKVCVIQNVVHLNESGNYSLCNSKKAIYAGRFDVQKDFGTMLKVWALVQQRYPEWVLNVYGNGELRPKFEGLVAERKLNVVIHPAVPNIMEKYMESSMLLMSSLYEPFGLVLVEAMSCGIPVVAFNCPYGPADIITDGVDGFLVEKRDVNVYANRVCQLIEDEQLRCDMGKAAVLSSHKYRAEIIMPQWKLLFENLVK
jgi:glycosyltransferase involved in cell wall biosynthesis